MNLNKFPRNEIPELLDNIKELEYQITDWFIPESDKNKEKLEEPDKYSILIYGTDENNITYCTKIINYEPYFYIKPPDSWNTITDNEFKKKVKELQIKLLEEKYETIWNDRNTKKSTKYNKKIIPNEYEKHLNNLEIVKKKDFWGFTNNKIFRYIKISTKSLGLYNNLKYYFMSLKDSFKLYESNIDPFLKYIHIQKIKPCGWIKINKYIIDTEQNTRSNYNIIAEWKDVENINKTKIAPLLIASFDIECNSSHGDFPVANKNYKKLSQDLCSIVKSGYDYNKKYIKSWILNAFIDDVVLDENYKINRLYSKNKIDIKDITSKLDTILDEIFLILEKIYSMNVDEDDEENDEIKITVKEYNDIEDKLTNLLTKNLPKLEGDKIIQIGTTVHKYGSDEIIYKNIITLDTCDDIENVDVVSCKTEKELLMNWKKLMIKLNPDVLIGYNIYGFDMEYMWLRVIENNIKDDFSMGLGRLLNRKTNLIEQKLSSSAMGENILKYIDMDGIVTIDLFKVIQREHKLDSYKLDSVASIFLKENKDDLKPNEIFKKFKGNSEDRCVIAKYCIQDCVLVNKLCNNLKILENNIGMGNVCLVPLNYLFKRGQGIKIFSLVNNECMKKDFLIPVIKNFTYDEYEEDGFEGAIVLEPKEGIYLNEPIVVFDYGSLYPSSMICRNLSHDTYVNDKKYLIDDPNIEYVTVNYDIYEGIGDKKIKKGVKECVFAQYKDGTKGIIPDILNMLLNERKNTKKKIEYLTITDKNNNIYSGFPEIKDDNYILFNIDLNEKFIINKNDIIDKKDTYNNFEKEIFDCLQNAYKITANSIYGQIGARTSPIYLKDIAACTTSTGREMIMIAKEFVETKYNAEVIYGDSVMPYTPITYKINDNINISTFEKLEGEWFDYLQFKSEDLDRINKEQFKPNNMKVWTHKGWSLVKRIIRHKTIKKIYRVLTNSGLIDVTEDHSLLNEKCEIIKPSECIIGEKLLHSKPDCIFNTEKYLKEFDKTQGYLTFDINNHVDIQKYYLILQQLNYNIIINMIGDCIYLYYTVFKIKNEKISNNIISIEILHEKYNGYVYDIETEEGVFHAGVGNMILKNTDSIFCKFPIKDEHGYDINGKEALSHAIKIGMDVEKNVVSILPKPQKLNYEKCLYPFILFSKKRYVGNLYEKDINKFKQKSMGIVLKRRDNANIVKKIYGGVIDIILNKQDLNFSVKFLKDELDDLVNGKTDIQNLILSKTLKSNYKDPTKIAHKVLADRIGSRDIGNKPAVNDRISYVYIYQPTAKLQGDRIESLDFIKENELKPDYLHYITNQIMKPILQLYALCITELPNYDKSENYWTELDEELKLKPLYQDNVKRKNRLDNLKLNYVKELLFDEFIIKLKEPKEKKKKIKEDDKIVKKVPEIKEKSKKVKEVPEITEEIVEIKEVKKVPEIKEKSKKVKEVPEITEEIVEITEVKKVPEIKEKSKKVKEVPHVIKEEIVEITEEIVEVQGFIDITLKRKLNIISINSNIKKNNNIIWLYSKEEPNNISKHDLIKRILLKMVENNSKSIIRIKINYKKFVKDYLLLLIKYKTFIDDKKIDILKYISENNDVGKLKDFNDLIINKDLIKIKDNIILE